MTQAALTDAKIKNAKEKDKRYILLMAKGLGLKSCQQVQSFGGLYIALIINVKC